MARFNYSPGVDKFNTSTDATIRIVAKQQAAMDLVAPTDVLVAADAPNGSLHARKYTTDGGTSNAIPQVSGVAALMVSVHKHLGVDLDLNDDGIVDNGPEVQRRAIPSLPLLPIKYRTSTTFPTNSKCYGAVQTSIPGFIVLSVHHFTSTQIIQPKTHCAAHGHRVWVLVG